MHPFTLCVSPSQLGSGGLGGGGEALGGQEQARHRQGPVRTSYMHPSSSPSPLTPWALTIDDDNDVQFTPHHHRLQAARAAGDAALVAELEEELAFLTMARQDPTQDEGAYQSYLDADDWYLKNRRI